MLRIVIHLEQGLVQAVYIAGNETQSCEVEVADLDEPSYLTKAEEYKYDQLRKELARIADDPEWKLIY